MSLRGWGLGRGREHFATGWRLCDGTRVARDEFHERHGAESDASVVVTRLEPVLVESAQNRDRVALHHVQVAFALRLLQKKSFFHKPSSEWISCEC